MHGGRRGVRVPLSPVAQRPRCLHNTRRCIRTFWDHSAGDVSAVCWGGGGGLVWATAGVVPAIFSAVAVGAVGTVVLRRGRGRVVRALGRKREAGGGGGRKGDSHDRPEGLFKAPPPPDTYVKMISAWRGIILSRRCWGTAGPPPPQKKELDPPPPPARKPISHCVMCGLCRVSCGTQHGRHPCGRHPPSRHCDW